MSHSTTPILRPLPFVERPDPCDWHADVVGGICDDCDPYVVMSDAEVHEIGERAAVLFMEALAAQDHQPVRPLEFDVDSARWVSNQTTEEWLAECERIDSMSHAEMLKRIGEQELVTVEEVPADEPEPEDKADEDLLDIDEDDRRKLGLLDFEALLCGEREPNVWLAPGLIQRGLLYQLVAAPKSGKSLLALEIAVIVAAGLARMAGIELPEGDSRVDGPVPVLYIDFENSPKTIGDRLREMGVDPASLARLHYASYPEFAPFDTERGAGEVLALARHLGVQLVIIDTVSRAVSGNENDAQTYLDLYRLLLSKLKREGIAVVRIDHTGKDAALGARGSSAKSGDVDVSWILTKGQTPARVKLAREFDRTHSHPEVIDLLRRQGPLRHEVVTGKVSIADLADDEMEGELTDEARALVADLDARNVPSRVGRDKAREAYLAAGGEIRASNGVWADAVAFRKRTALL